MKKEPVFHIIVGALLSFSAIVCVLSMFGAVVCMGKHLEYYWWAIAGIAVYAVFARFVGAWRNGFILKLQLQAVRLFVGLLLGRTISELVITDDTDFGHVTMQNGDHLVIRLAPYCLLLFPLLLLAIKMLFPDSAQWFTGLVGFSTAIQLHAIYKYLDSDYKSIAPNKKYRDLYIIIIIMSTCLGLIIYGIYMGLGAGFYEFFSSIWHCLSFLVTG